MRADHVHRCRYCDEALATEESVLAKSAERSAAMAAMVHGHNVKLVEERKALRAAFERSDADVTRLVAELAESVRALAVSQGEVAEAKALAEGSLDAQADCETRMFAMRRDLDNALGDVDYWKKARQSVSDLRVAETDRADRATVEAERLRGDLERARGLAKRLVGGVEVHENCACILCGFVRFLAETAPAASPEPDRASPEVTVKENSK